MNRPQSYDDEKFKTRLVGYASSDGGGSSEESDSDDSVTEAPSKRLKRDPSNHSFPGNTDDARFKNRFSDPSRESKANSHATNFKREEFSHPVFQQGSGTGNPEPRASKRGSDRRERPKATDQDLLVFGYAAKIFNMKECFENGFIDLETEGISIENKSVSDLWLRRSLFDPEITLDRFDVRNLCDFGSLRAPAAPKVASDSYLDSIRYEYLDCDEGKIFAMSEDEREEFLEKKSREATLSTHKPNVYGYNYEGKADPKPTSPAEDLEFSFPVPEGMTVPRTLKQLVVIEKTAKFVLASKDPLLEVKIQGRQGNLAEFRFLNRDDPLHAFYQKVKTLVKLGLYSYCKAEAGDESNSSATPSNFVPAPPEEPQPGPLSAPSGPPEGLAPEQQQFILLFAKTAAFKGPTFEQKFRAERGSTPEFSFLLPWNKAHAFYLGQLEEARNVHAGNDADHLGLVLPSKEFETNQLVSALSQQVARLGCVVESQVYPASLFCKSLDFVLPWSPLNKYYSWKKQKCLKDTAPSTPDELGQLVASQVAFRGPEFEKELQLQLCHDKRFSFLMPWDPHHASFKEMVGAASPSKPTEVEECSAMAEYAKVFALHGPNLEHQIRSISLEDPAFTFLYPWGLGHRQYLQLLARELTQTSCQQHAQGIPPPDLQPLVDELALAKSASLRLSLLTNPVERLFSVRYGHRHYNYFFVKTNHAPAGSAIDVSFSAELHSLFSDDQIARELPQDLVGLVSRMELCSWLQARFAWFGAWLQHRAEFPFLSSEHPLNADYNRIVHLPAEVTHEVSPFFPEQEDRLVMDALAGLASLSGGEFQRFLVDSKELGEAFPFLQPTHAHHTYYRWKVAYPSATHVDYCCSADDAIFLLELGTLSPEQCILINTTAAFAVRHGKCLESLLWPNSLTGNDFSFIDPTNEYHAYYERKKSILTCAPLESPSFPPEAVQSSCDKDVICKIARLVSEMGAAFEQQVYLDYPEKLAFIHPRNPMHSDYLAQLQELKAPVKAQPAPPSPPPPEPSVELSEIQKQRLARVKKLFHTENLL